MSEFGLRPIFDTPSRVNGKRCVDNIFTDRCLHPLETYAINMHLGDHLAQIAAFQLASETETKILVK